MMLVVAYIESSLSGVGRAGTGHYSSRQCGEIRSTRISKRICLQVFLDKQDIPRGYFPMSAPEPVSLVRVSAEGRSKLAPLLLGVLLLC